MTIHYHGTPISPRAVLNKLAGRHFCVSYWRPDDVVACHDLGQSVMLDNGAFSAWRLKERMDWLGFYRFAEKWLRYRSTWAVIPDVIDGTEEQNDKLIEQWPHGQRGAPVWHMHETIERLKRLCGAWPRVCIGSSGDFARVGDFRWHERMTLVMNEICGDEAAPTWLHMLRGMALSGFRYPFASVDSTDVGRNHNREYNDAVTMAQAWDRQQCPAVWTRRPWKAEAAQ